MTNTFNVRESRVSKSVDAQTFKNFIGGQWVEPASQAYFDNRNPAKPDDLIGRFPDSDPRDIDAAVRSARRGFEIWSKTPAPARGDVLRRVGDLLVQRKDAIANAMTREMGKVLAETRGDVQEGIDTAFYAATEAGDAGVFTWRVGASAPERLGSIAVATAHFTRPEWTPDSA